VHESLGVTRIYAKGVHNFQESPVVFDRISWTTGSRLPIAPFTRLESTTQFKSVVRGHCLSPLVQVIVHAMRLHKGVANVVPQPGFLPYQTANATTLSCPPHAANGPQ
jgi:hypothetical protein